MTRRQKPILNMEQDGDWWTVYQWLTHRVDGDEMKMVSDFMTAPVSRAMEDGKPVEEIQAARVRVTETWRELQGEWRNLFAQEGNELPNSAYASIVEKTNIWIDEMLPAGRDRVGNERKRLLTAIRQMRSKERRSRDWVNVQISGSRLDAIYKAGIEKTLESDFVRAALDLVLASPELIAAAKQKSGV
jgi:hypothetical protein